MSDITPIIVALITGGISLIGVVVTNNNSNKSIENKLTVSQAITDTKLDNLTEEVRKHNNFAMKIPLIEKDIERMKDDINELKKAE